MPQAAATGTKLLENVRALLQDEFDDPSLPNDSTFDYRYETASLVDIVNNAMGEAERLRPDLFLGTFTATSAALTSGTLASWTLPIPMTYFQPVVNYVAGMAQARDDEFSPESRAGVLLATFYSALGASR